jgi:hypothetical protein
MSTPALDSTGHLRLSLREIVHDYGAAGLDDTGLLGRLLPDMLAGSPRETAIMLAAASGGTARLLAERVAQGLPIDTAVSDVSVHLASESMLDSAACRWIVIAYAGALGYPVAHVPAEPERSADPVATRIDPAARTDSPPPVVARAAVPLSPNATPVPAVSPPAMSPPGVSPAMSPSGVSPAVSPAGDRASFRGWLRRNLLLAVLLLLAGLVDGLISARAPVSADSEFGHALIWWLVMFAPISVGVLLRTRSDQAVDVIAAIVALAVAALLVAQAVDQQWHFIDGLGLAATDGLAMGVLALRWYDRTDSRWARAAAAIVTALAIYLIQRLATWTMDFPSTDHTLRAVAQSLLFPAVLIATSVGSWALSRIRPKNVSSENPPPRV